MKKIICMVLAAVMMLSCIAMAEIKMGQADYAAHGTKCFCVATVAMDGEKIAGVYLDEFQWLSSDWVGVPNSDAGFGESYPEGKVLGSKKANAAAYSENMKKAGSTVPLDQNYAAIEAFCTGKTVAELEAFLEGKDKPAVVDAVSGATLVDTMGYINAVIAAAKSVQ